MRSTLNYIVGAVLMLLLLALAVMPKVVSSNVQASTTANLYALFPPETRRQIQIVEASYESGWFNSDARYDISYTPFGASESLVIELNFDFMHGPLLLTADGIRLGLAYADIQPRFANPQFTEALLDIPFALPELSMGMLLGLDETLEIKLDVAPAVISDNTARVNFDGLQATLEVAPDMSAIFRMDMGRLDAMQTGGGMGFSIGSLSLNSETEQINNLLANSDALLEILELGSPGPLAFTSKAISANSSIRNNSTTEIDVSQQFAVNEIESELPLRAFTWTMELNELHSSVIRQYYDVLSEMQEQLTDVTASRSGDGDVIGDMLDQLGLVVLQNRLAINNYFTANAYGGDHSLDIELRWLGLPQVNSYEELTMAAVIDALQLQIDLSLALEAVQQSPVAAMVEPYLQQGYITVNNNRIGMELSLGDRQLVLNGATTPLEQIFPTVSQ
jgi:uncharacterized protein YdgA (DUF945 family)